RIRCGLHELHGDLAIEQRVACEVDLAHGTAAEQPNEPVLVELVGRHPRVVVDHGTPRTTMRSAPRAMGHPMCVRRALARPVLGMWAVLLCRGHSVCGMSAHRACLRQQIPYEVARIRNEVRWIFQFTNLTCLVADRGHRGLPVEPVAVGEERLV